MNRGKSASLVKNAALVLSGLLAALILVEGLLRLGGGVYGFLQHDAERFDLSDEKEVRILCVGESTTALGLSTSYPKLLERELRRRHPGRAFAAINEGVPGISTAEILARLPGLIDRIRPRIAILMMGCNDMSRPGPRGSTPGFFKRLRVVKLLRLAEPRGQAGPGTARAAAAPGPQAPVPLEPESPRADFERGLAAVADGNYAEAEAAFDRFARTGRDHAAIADRLIGELSAKIPELDRLTRRHAEKAAALNPRLPRPHSILASLAMENGDREGFRRHLARAVEAGSADPSDRRRLAELDAPPRRDAPAAFQCRPDELFGDPATTENYRKAVSLLLERGVLPVAMQYPRLSDRSLRRALRFLPGVLYIENRRNFEKALEDGKYEDLFTDRFGEVFGHLSPAGRALMAEGAAEALDRYRLFDD